MIYSSKLLQPPRHFFHLIEQFSGFDQELNFFDILTESSITFDRWNLFSNNPVSFFNPNSRLERKQEIPTLV